MIVTCLGTGTSQGIPVIGCSCEVCRSSNPKDNRLRTSIHLSDENHSVVIDTGPDFRQQMLRENIKTLDAVIYTHPHKDHIAGMDDIRSFNFMLKKAIPIYLNQLTLNQLKKEFDYVFNPNGYGGSPQLDIRLIKDKQFNLKEWLIFPIQVQHAKMTVLGFRIKDFTYITDANYISDEEREKIFESKVLVINALQKKSHVSHFNLEQALMEIEKINPGKAYLTHISHKMGLHDEVNRQLPENVFLAYDGLKIEI